MKIKEYAKINKLTVAVVAKMVNDKTLASTMDENGNVEIILPVTKTVSISNAKLISVSVDGDTIHIETEQYDLYTDEMIVSDSQLSASCKKKKEAKKKKDSDIILYKSHSITPTELCGLDSPTENHKNVHVRGGGKATDIVDVSDPDNRENQMSDQDNRENQMSDQDNRENQMSDPDIAKPKTKKPKPPINGVGKADKAIYGKIAEEIVDLYEMKTGGWIGVKERTITNIVSLVMKEGYTWSEIEQATIEYAKETKGRDKQYISKAQNFYRDRIQEYIDRARKRDNGVINVDPIQYVIDDDENPDDYEPWDKEPER